jgi:hypothetical protein
MQYSKELIFTDIVSQGIPESMNKQARVNK